MRKDVATWWIAEMRSDNHTKGKGYMRRRIGADMILTCPLGILMEVALNEGLDVKVEFHDGGEHGDTYWTYDGSYGAPPIAAALWAGQEDGYLLLGWKLVVPDAVVDEINGARPGDTPYFRHGDEVPLSTVNDYTNCSLAEMAGFMELHFLK